MLVSRKYLNVSWDFAKEKVEEISLEYTCDLKSGQKTCFFSSEGVIVGQWSPTGVDGKGEFVLLS